MSGKSGTSTNSARLFSRAWIPIGSSALLVAVSAFDAGCGGSTSQGGAAAPGDDGGGIDAATTMTDDGGGLADGGSGDDAAVSVVDAAPDVNNGAPSSTYPAFPVVVGQVKDNGGEVLAAPLVVTVTWSTDPDVDTYDSFGDTIGASSYWHTINSEYGVGPATSGAANHVNITTPAPASFSDSDLDTLVDANVGSAWPAVTSNTIYALYLPPGTTLTSGGANLCQEGVGGYHTVSQQHRYVYAIMPHCAGFATADVELAASHELNEASTDPLNHGAAYVGFDSNSVAYDVFNQFQDEIGDACESFPEAIFADDVDFSPYTVQRQWSNKSAAAGSHWCVPALPEPWFNTTFLASSPLDTIDVNLSSIGAQGGGLAKGLKIPLNTTRTIPIGFFSDRPTSGPFTLAIKGLSDPLGQSHSTGANIANGTATITLDKTSGVNGEIANLTITPTAFSSLNVIFFYVRATLPGSTESGYLPVLISKN